MRYKICIKVWKNVINGKRECLQKNNIFFSKSILYKRGLYPIPQNTNRKSWIFFHVRLLTIEAGGGGGRPQNFADLMIRLMTYFWDGKLFLLQLSYNFSYTCLIVNQTFYDQWKKIQGWNPRLRWIYDSQSFTYYVSAELRVESISSYSSQSTHSSDQNFQIHLKIIRKNTSISAQFFTLAFTPKMKHKKIIQSELNTNRPAIKHVSTR